MKPAALGFSFIRFSGALGIVSHFYLLVKSVYKGDFLSVNSFGIVRQLLKQSKCTKSCCV